MTTLVLATRNKGKIAELHDLLTAFDVVGLEAFPDAPEVPETELTFAGNALLKARAIAAHTGLTAVSDDSGLCVDALNGMPGVLSARWSGRYGAAAPEGVDRANLQLLLDQLADVQDFDRGAHFVCAAAIVHPDGREDVFEGRMEGRIVRTPRGANGFGYDPIFEVTALSRTTAELTPHEKSTLSHRAHAFRALATSLGA
ncbi:RdgB/HAM1 family non-canonical purine NTP pyrophosphatase [Actinocorallia sp. A-T 12471]|uniref:RdgB/HAM1 family non-canonical purine NTP pyrophosphatase n=1 Tax=Actinocorallia sp. A-T 12471 TaxID=3089813 RepID=UPI0029CBAEE7|nr:RdgB/HAM1 family non-canonical purine NTP pyrophosphatase [Actinocorallia sp. A-T 12471]MDX6743680.1 RdgB/HAM1 family non-canonical purine NTP pyrophosphatase [Actinocorallia sp. A-T 12471]